MLNITSNDKDIIRHLGYPKPVKLSSGTYYLKLATKAEVLKELIGRYVSENIFHITVPAYDYIIVDNEYYVISPDLNLNGSFTLASTIFSDDTNFTLNNIKSVLISQNCDTNVLLKGYFFDIIFLNGDRDSKNWGILETLNDKKIVFLDNEKMLIKPGINLAIHSSDDPSLSGYKDLEHFLASNPSFIDLFASYLNNLTPKAFYNIINLVANKNAISLKSNVDFIPDLDQTLYKIYSENYQKLTIILNNFKKESVNHVR